MTFFILAINNKQLILALKSRESNKWLQRSKVSYWPGYKLDFRDLCEEYLKSSLLVSERSSVEVAQGLTLNNFFILCPSQDKSCAQTFTTYLHGMLCSLLPVLFCPAPDYRVSRLLFFA